LGSYARKIAVIRSDIDGAVVPGDFSVSISGPDLLLTRVRRGVDLRIERHPFRNEDCHDENPLVPEVKRHSIVIR
jgi:predicted nucleotidyltransferase